MMVGKTMNKYSIIKIFVAIVAVAGALLLDYYPIRQNAVAILRRNHLIE